MLDKTQYSSWASRMLLYIKGKEKGKLLVDLVLNGPFKYGTVTVPGTQTTHATVRDRTYDELINAEKLHESCDIKATNIGLLVPSDDLIASLNTTMAFISITFTSRYLPTNNQLRTSSNPRNQETIQGGRVAMQTFHGRQNKEKVYMERQCTKPKRPRNLAWFKEKAMLAEALESGMVLDEEQMTFLANNRDTVTTCQQSQEILTPTTFQTDYLDALNNECDEAPSASAILMAKLSSYDLEVLSENDHFLELLIPQDLVHNAVNSLAEIIDYQSMEKSYLDEYSKCLELKAELSKRNDMVENPVYDKLLKRCARMEHKCISLEIKVQQYKESFQNNQPRNKPNAPEFLVFFEINELKAQLKAKDNSISNLKDHIATLKGKSMSEGLLCGGVRTQFILSGQFCDCDLKIAFRKHTCYVRDLEGVDLLKGSRGSNLYTMSLEEMMQSSLICLLYKASKNKSWLWHQRLSHLNFGAINDLAKQGLVRGLPKLKYQKNHLCSACSLGKSKKHTHKPKSDDSIQEKLYLLHMDLCGPMRIESINGKKYILVIVDDYLRFTWVKLLRSKYETPEIMIKVLKKIQVRLNAIVRNIQTDNGT
nr:hypothetical protein [Tanacetum cinerariifolium]